MFSRGARGPGKVRYADSGLEVHAGQKWVMRMQGLAQVIDVVTRNDKTMVGLKLPEDDVHVHVPVELMSDESVVRAPMSPSAAQAAWTALVEPGCEPDPRKWSERMQDYESAFTGSDGPGLVPNLREIYARPELTNGERSMMRKYEKVLFTELADVLGRPLEEVRDEARGPRGSRSPDPVP